MSGEEIEIDYAIIGAGVAGTYCAWRLQEAHGKSKSIVLFENSDRIGGRLLTVKFPGSNLKAELGGMRYMPMQKTEGSKELMGHKIFSWLVNKFELETEDFPMGSLGDEEWGDNNYAFFRGQHFKIMDLRDAKKSTAFNVDWSERGKSPNMLQEHVQTLLIPGADKFESLKDWMDVKVFGVELWKYGFWNLLYRALSPEAYLLLKYGSGYDTNASNGNAVALLPILKDYLSTTQYRTLKEGMMSLPQTLAAKFESLEGKVDRKDRIKINHRLESISEKENGYYRLSFAITRTNRKKRELTIVDPKSPPCIWKAKNVILALPTAALQKIRWKPLQSSEEVVRMLDSAFPQEAIKLVLEYPYAWWKALKLFRGRSITDLPLRQTFYFSDLDDLKVDPYRIEKDKPALLMASYSDIEAVPFWRGLEGNDLDDEKNDYDGHPHGYRAAKMMVREAHKQVMRIHGKSELPEPVRAAYFDWADSPYGGAWHAWKPGYQYDKVIDEIRRPVQTENVFICGEAYSGFQGWAEGALETAEELLKKDLDPADQLKSIFQEKVRGFAPLEQDIVRVDSKGRKY